ncbi:MAG: PQQ-binding-like beta-propeller repeat protein [Methanoregula sp.]|nr:PQQ-binding-like beta-propeller repeat protein [Methanoregula sp.]
MTARRIFLGSRRRPLQIAVALVLVMVAVLLAAGCIGCFLSPTGCMSNQEGCPNALHSPTITRLDPNGNVTWTKVLDSDLSNGISDLVPTYDGGFVTAGAVASTHSGCTLNYQGRLIQFSGNGEILWDRVIPEEGGISEIILLRDGGFAALLGNNIYRLDSEGRTLWNRSTGCSSPYGERSTIAATSDGGLVVAGPVFVKFDDKGKTLWQRSLKDQSLVGPVYIDEIEGEGGYNIFSLTATGNPRGIFKLKYDAEGNFINSSRITNADRLLERRFYHVPDGLKLIFMSEEQDVMMIHLDHDGTLLDYEKISSSEYVTLTDDQEYFFIEFNPNSLQSVKLNPDGARSWNTTLPNANLRTLSFFRVFPTTDGGYVVVSDNIIVTDISSLKN